jgi:hypothetical protein
MTQPKSVAVGGPHRSPSEPSSSQFIPSVRSFLRIRSTCQPPLRRSLRSLNFSIRSPYMWQSKNVSRLTHGTAYKPQCVLLHLRVNDGFPTIPYFDTKVGLIRDHRSRESTFGRSATPDHVKHRPRTEGRPLRPARRSAFAQQILSRLAFWWNFRFAS